MKATDRLCERARGAAGNRALPGRVIGACLIHAIRIPRLSAESDFDPIAVGLLERDCAELEVRAFTNQAVVTRALWPDELPGGTDWERGLAVITTTYESGGADGLRAMMVGVEGYAGERCRARAMRSGRRSSQHVAHVPLLLVSRLPYSAACW